MSDQTLERLKLALHDRYAIERRIGQGGMATVYLAEDLKHRRQVAIKVLRPELSASLGAERFLREIELAAKLQHPHIVPVYDSGSADDVLYYVMPFVDGESLRDLMAREGRLTLERAAEIIREASSGLSYAHSHGVVHRDVKPENIMLSDGHAVVTDFGIARAIETARAADSHLTGAGMAIGTPAYMSPEQATADKVDARSDQYALACVFYELVTGKQAFSGPTMQAMLTSMLTGPRPRMATIVDDVPPPVDAATQRALSSDPTQRFNSINEFARAVSAETSGAAAATRESRRWKRLAIALPVIVALLGAAWVAFMGQRGRSVVSGAETIAVVPFTVSGSGLEGIGEGMVDLLAANLDGVGEIRAIEPRTVMREWRRRVSEGAGSLEDALAVGRSTRAASVLTGSIVASGGTARLTAELYDLDGNRLALTTVSGPTDSVLTLADALTLSLLREVWRSREPLPSANAFAINSASMPAIRAYLTGERYHRRGEWDSAQVAFEEAVQADSTFALAWHRLANTLGWKGLYQGPEARDAAARAVQYSDSLPPRMRSLLYATNLFQLGDYATADSAESYLRRYPDDADGWYLLGEARFHGRELRPYSPAELREPFDKVLALDSSLTPAAIHPMELAIQMNDPALMRRYEAVFEAAGATAALREAELASLALRGSDSAMAELLSSSATGSGAALSALSGFIQSGASGDSLVSTMSRLVTRLQDESPQFAAFPAVMAASLGRIDTALVLMGPAADSDNGFYIRMFPVLAGVSPALERTLCGLRRAGARGDRVDPRRVGGRGRRRRWRPRGSRRS